MLSVIVIVLVGLLVGWISARHLEGLRAYVLGGLISLVLTPLAGMFAAWVGARLFGGDVNEGLAIALGLGIAVALIETPLVIFKHLRRSDRPQV